MPIQESVIDITEWDMDDEFNQYPEGARPKIAAFSPEQSINNQIKPSWRYLLKGSVRWAPEQFWGEIIAYHIGRKIGVQVPPAYVGVHRTYGYAGALIEWFYADHQASFVSAGQYFSSKYPDFDRERGKKHNLLDALEITKKVIELPRNQQPDLLMGVAFDAIIGNTDRHQENWGFLSLSRKQSGRKARRSASPFYKESSLAPFFDNGTSLGFEVSKERACSWTQETLDNYIRRGQHHFTEEYSSARRLSHMQSIELIGENVVLKQRLRAALMQITSEFIEELLANICAIQGVPDESMLSAEKASFIAKLTQRRVEVFLEKIA